MAAMATCRRLVLSARMGETLTRVRLAQARCNSQSGLSHLEPKERVWHLPDWAKQETKPPLQLRLLGFTMLLPLGAGSLAVHLLAEEDQETENEDYSRMALNWSLHYAGALLSCAGALHCGMQLANLGVPKRSDYMGLYYLCAFMVDCTDKYTRCGWQSTLMSPWLTKKQPRGEKQPREGATSCKSWQSWTGLKCQL